MSTDLVQRHASLLSRRADAQMPAVDPANNELPAAAPRLKALHGVLRSELPAKAGAAARFVAVDLDHCARQFFLALKAGAAFREPAAAALMSSAAALGARWLGDERLYTRGLEADDDADFDGNPDHQGMAEVLFETLPEPVDPGQLKAWAETSWAARFRQASRRNRGMRVQTQYALTHAVANDFSPQALRTIADAVFRPDEIECLTRFMGQERSLIAAAGLDSKSLGERHIESLCIGADLVFGLGRFVRLAQAATAQGQLAANGSNPSASVAVPNDEHLNNHLREALNALAEQPQ
ncbi:MAG: hypothetical protein ABI564_16770 [Ideonella sp.]